MSAAHTPSIVQQVVVATVIALSLFGGFGGVIGTLTGLFVGWPVILFGLCLLAYSVAGFVIAERTYADMTFSVVRLGVLWSGVGAFNAIGLLDAVLGPKTPYWDWDRRPRLIKWRRPRQSRCRSFSSCKCATLWVWRSWGAVWQRQPDGDPMPDARRRISRSPASQGGCRT
jgi:hypothetical protein